MPWYKAGTVSVVQNSNAVLGAGTAFILNGRVGDAFRGPDGGWYEITNIVSDTAMSISPNYQGANNSGGVYAIAPMQGYVKDSADALRALVNQYGAKLAALGETANYDILPISKGGTGFGTKAEAKAALDILDIQTVARGGTGADNAAGALANLGALALSGGRMTGALNEATVVTVPSASTVDIGAAAANTLQISGTTTITSLGVAPSGTRRSLIFQGALILTHNSTTLQLPGAVNIQTASGDSAEFISFGAGAWFCLRYTLANGKALRFAYDRSNSVGTVSQASGVPTGGLMEYVSNSAGEAWKFANGLMICVTTVTRTITLGTAFGAMFYPGAASSGPSTPATFVGTPYNSLVISGGGNLSTSAPTGSIPSGAYQNFYHMAPISSPAASFTYSYLAIGRWY